MANIDTGEMYTQEQYDKLLPEQKTRIVGVNQEESVMLSKMNRKNRRAWLKNNKKV